MLGSERGVESMSGRGKFLQSVKSLLESGKVCAFLFLYFFFKECQLLFTEMISYYVINILMLKFPLDILCLACKA